MRASQPSGRRIQSASLQVILDRRHHGRRFSSSCSEVLLELLSVLLLLAVDSIGQVKSIAFAIGMDLVLLT